jgi:hypothetical protein
MPSCNRFSIDSQVDRIPDAEAGGPGGMGETGDSGDAIGLRAAHVQQNFPSDKK